MFTSSGVTHRAVVLENGSGPESSFVFLGMLDFGGIVREVNRTALEQVSLRSEDVYGQRLEETFWWSYSGQEKEHLRSMVEKSRRGEASRSDCMIRLDGGRFLRLSLSLIPLCGKEDRVDGIIVLGLDSRVWDGNATGDRKRGVQGGISGVFEWSPARRTVAWSEEIRNSCGLSEYCRYKDWRKRVHRDDISNLECTVFRAIEARRGWSQVQFRVQDRQGVYRRLEAELYYCYDRTGALNRIAGFCVEIAQFGEGDSDHGSLEEVNAALRRSNEELQQFASAVSHDLQEPLRAVAVYSELVGRQNCHSLDAESRRHLEVISNSAKRMSSLIRDLLAHARVEAESGSERVRLDEALGDALENLRVAIEESAAKVEWSSLGAVRADRKHVAQLFQNLIGNAIKYRRNVAPAIQISARSRSSWTLVTVRDNGQGFDEKHAKEIFDVFKRLQGRERSGTGIGLAICKRIVERFRGRIWAEGRPGEGAVFRFTLPSE